MCICEGEGRGGERRIGGIVKRESEKSNEQEQSHCNTLQHTATHCNTLQHREIERARTVIESQIERKRESERERAKERERETVSKRE